MKIKIKKDAKAIYIGGGGRLPVNWEWVAILEKIAGTTIEVETDFLFKDQFNTVPVPGVAEKGLRIMQDVVEEVIDDVRPGKARCNWCGKISANQLVCMACGKRDFLEVF
jgi:rRNA maturation endonuclease Nob1